MSLANTSVLEISNIQYKYKLKSYMWFVFSLIPLQVLALLLSLNGVMSSSSSSNFLSISTKYYSNDIFIIFTMLWAFIGSMTLTIKMYHNADFTFISNRLSSNLSNIMFLLTISILGSFTAVFSGFLLRVILYFFIDSHMFLLEYFTPPITDTFLSVVILTLYLWLITSIGYLFGKLVQIFKPFIIFIPAAIIGVQFMTSENKLNDLIMALTTETSIVFFSLKTILTSIIFFGSAIIITNRLEVRK